MWLLSLDSKSSNTHNVTICHSEGGNAESRNLRISSPFAGKLVPGSLDALSLARDDNCSYGFYKDIIVVKG